MRRSPRPVAPGVPGSAAPGPARGPASALPRVAAVLALEREIFPTPWTEGILHDELAAPGRSYVVA